jgi:hypothetical protein
MCSLGCYLPRIVALAMLLLPPAAASAVVFAAGGAARARSSDVGPALAGASTPAECTWTNNTDYYGNIGNVGANLTAQECCSICKHHPNCTFAVFGKAGEHPPRSCWLKHGLATRNKHFYVPGTTSRGPYLVIQHPLCTFH